MSESCGEISCRPEPTDVFGVEVSKNPGAEALQRVRSFVELDIEQALAGYGDEEDLEIRHKYPWQLVAFELQGINDAVATLRRECSSTASGTFSAKWDVIEGDTGVPTISTLYCGEGVAHNGEIVQLYYGYDPLKRVPSDRARLETIRPLNSYLEEFLAGTLHGSHQFDCSAGGKYETGKFEVYSPFLSGKIKDLVSYTKTTQQLLRLFLLATQNTAKLPIRD